MAQALSTASVLVLWGSLLMIASSVEAATVLLREWRLNKGGALGEGSYIFQMQENCQVTLKNGNSLVWTVPSNSQGNTNCSCRMQENGDMVIYTDKGKALWSTGTEGKNGAYVLLDCTGKLAMYTARGTEVWSVNDNLNEEVEVNELEEGKRLRARKASKESLIVQTVLEANV